MQETMRLTFILTWNPTNHKHPQTHSPDSAPLIISTYPAALFAELTSVFGF